MFTPQFVFAIDLDRRCHTSLYGSHTCSYIFLTMHCHRYTECRLRALTDEALLADLDKDTVDFFPTFDASQVGEEGGSNRILLAVQMD